MEETSVKKYYNKYVARQNHVGVNDRIYKLYKRLKHEGLKSDSNVLELGCGVGIVTTLICRVVKKGRIESVDISDESIKEARIRVKQKNVSFFTHSIVNYKPVSKKFDFIVLFDVLEHIPVESHQELFDSISGMISDETKLLINIPSPESIEYDRVHRPEVLQIIDEPMYPEYIIHSLANEDLRLRNFISDGIWLKNDYDFYCFEKKKDFDNLNLDKNRSFIKRLSKYIFRLYLRFYY